DRHLVDPDGAVDEAVVALDTGRDQLKRTRRHARDELWVELAAAARFDEPVDNGDRDRPSPLRLVTGGRGSGAPPPHVVGGSRRPGSRIERRIVLQDGLLEPLKLAAGLDPE